LPVKGRIIRISGPLVVAEGMSGAKMYEMVRVGEDRLIGEITRIRGDLAYIQVYESTSGLRPGEPVEGTGYPLSVELGPGLIGTIYDGVQRPLPLIAEVIAKKAPHRRMFIERGIEVPPISREKKWSFNQGDPEGRFKLRPGDKVGPGDVLGWVQETEIIKHKIMVPPGVHGRLRWLASEGDYTVEDPIAEVEVDGEVKEITMVHRWPVRTPRPFKEKLEPTEPLITGMRIIDTLFPIAKGGTAAIPGGFGTGKCVTPDTPILLANGELIPIKELFERYSKQGVKIYYGPDEEVIDVSHLNLEIITFEAGRFRKSIITHLYKGRSRKLVEIKTKSGRVLKVTPAHKLLFLNEKGLFEERPAITAKPGSLLVMPKKLSIEAEPQQLIDYLPKEVLIKDPEALEDFRAIIEILIKKYGDIDSVAKLLGIDNITLREILENKRYPNVSQYLKAFKLIGLKVSVPRTIGIPNTELTLRIPEHINEDLAELLGLATAIISNSLKTERDITNVKRRICELVIKVFNVKYSEICLELMRGSGPLLEFLYRLIKAKVSGNGDICVPSAIMKSPKKVIASFLRGYYLAGGGYDKGKIYLSVNGLCLVSGLTYLLSRLGVLYRVKAEDEGYYKIVIEDKKDIKTFYNELNLKELKSSEVNKGIKLKHHLGEVNIKEALGMSSTTLNSEVTEINAEGISTLQTLKKELLSNKVEGIEPSSEHVFIDEVVEVKVLEGDFTVYDITVPKTHNFVGGIIPSIFHNTVTLHSLAQWSSANVVIYIGCGERGNEMTEVLVRFPKYKDPWTGKPLMERTILIANTSNMPVAAREASIYTGVTLAEYYRDMGYDVLLVADSTSRWAEALREIAGRLEEMPAEEGYPSYLASRLAEFYERAGRVVALGSPEKVGSVTLVGAVSPPGGDFTEPVTSHTKRFIRVFWALDTKLAYSRHYPAINWLLSYSAYVDTVESWWSENVDPLWREYRDEAMNILSREEELMEIVRLVGTEGLDEKDKLILETARLLKEGFLKQNAFDPVDAFTPPLKQFKLLKMIIDIHRKALEMIERGLTVAQIKEALGRLYLDIVRAKFMIPNDKPEEVTALEEKVLKRLEEYEAQVMSGG
jgi:V/A-type H+-transporting ATPase subunit A